LSGGRQLDRDPPTQTQITVTGASGGPALVSAPIARGRSSGRVYALDGNGGRLVVTVPAGPRAGALRGRVVVNVSRTADLQHTDYR